MAKQISIKQIKIDKASATIVIVTSVAAFVIIFSLTASKVLVGQLSYQNRVTAAKQVALNQLKTDVLAEKQLVGSYKGFIDPPQNIIGGSSTGTQVNDGNNAQIILDALPSQYDFPALTSSVQAVLNRESVNIDSISGIDNQIQQQTQTVGSTAPVAMPITFLVDGTYQNIQNVVNDFQNSIRPFQMQTMIISGDQSDITLNIAAQTYYQPAKQFTITNEMIQ